MHLTVEISWYKSWYMVEILNPGIYKNQNKTYANVESNSN